MADLAVLQIRVATSGINQAVSELQKLGINADKVAVNVGNAQKATNSFDKSMSGLIMTVSRIAALVGGIYALTNAFKQGISIVDKYNVGIVGIAAQLTNLAKTGTGMSMEAVFEQNTGYAQTMYKAMALESANHFASLNEMQTVYNRLVQSGYSVRLDEVAALGILADNIKLKTAGQNVEVQLNTEILALMQGQMRNGSLLAMELQSRLGPGWAKLVEKHKEAGDLLKWLADLYPGLTVANEKIKGTLQSQLATTQSLLDLVAIGGLSGAYSDIVNLIKQANSYLKEHGDELSGKIATAWSNISGSVSGIATFIGQATLALIDFGTNLDRIAQNPLVGILWGAAAGSRLGPWGALVGGAAGGAASLQSQNNSEVQRGIDRGRGAGGIGPNGEGAESFYPMPNVTSPAPIQPPKLPGSGAAGGGGKGGADNALKEAQKLAKEVDKARKDAMTAESEAFMFLYKLKEANIDMYASQSKNQYEIKGAYKDSYETLASLSPVVSEQNDYKRKALKLEIDISKHTLETKIHDLGINETQAAQLRNLEDLTAQAKKYNFEMENNKGIKSWAYNRVKADSQKNNWADAMNGLESFVTDAWQQGITGALSKTKVDFMEIAKTMATSVLLNLGKKGIEKGFGAIAELISGKSLGKIGTRSNPMVVEVTNMQGVDKSFLPESKFDRTVKQAEKTAYSFDGGKAGGLDSVQGTKALEKEYNKYLKMRTKGEKSFDKLDDTLFKEDKKENQFISKDWMKLQQDRIQASNEFYNNEQASQSEYEMSFGSMLNNVSNLWLLGQAAMTAAGVEGDTARIVSMIGFGLKAISILWNIVKEGALAKAWEAGAAAYASVWSFVGFPVAVVLAPAMAAVAFAGTLAAASGGGKAGGGGGGAQTYHTGGMVGYSVAHEGLMVDERLIKAQVGEGIIKRSTMDLYSRKGITFDMLNNGKVSGEGGGGTVVNSPVTYSPVINAIDARGVEAVLKQHGKTMVKTINREIGRHGKNLYKG